MEGGAAIEADEEEDNLESFTDSYANIKQNRKKRREEGKLRDWVPSNCARVTRCTVCEAKTSWQGKCQDCTEKRCQSWMDSISLASA